MSAYFIFILYNLAAYQLSSNVTEQISAIGQLLPLLKDYQVVVLGDREFCSVELANWRADRELTFLFEA